MSLSLAQQRNMGSKPPPHKIWKIPEIVTMIVGHLKLKHQAPLLRVSKLFLTVAAPLVWKSTRDTALTPLLPNDTTAPQADPWRRFHLYAPFIQIIQIHVPRSGPSDTVSSLLLRTGLGYTPFSALREAYFKFETWDNEFINIVQRTTSSAHMNVLKFTLPDRDGDKALSRIVELLGTTTHSLVKLQIDAGSQSMESDDAPLAAVLKKHPNLVSLHLCLPKISVLGVILAAGELKQLQDLSLVSQEKTAPATPTSDLPTNLFPSLITMTADLPSSVLLALLSLTSSTSLTALKIKTGMQPPLEALTTTCLDPISKFTTLTKVDIKFNTKVEDWDRFIPLLACRRLQEVAIGEIVPSSPEWSNAVLSSMAEAWPDLRKLNLRASLKQADHRNPATITWKGLIPLARHCPSLASLTLNIDARWIYPEDIPALSHTLSSTTQVNLGFSHIDRDVETTSKWLAKMFPGLKQMVTLWGGSYGADALMKGNWEKIKERVKESLGRRKL